MQGFNNADDSYRKIREQIFRMKERAMEGFDEQRKNGAAEVSRFPELASVDRSTPLRRDEPKASPAEEFGGAMVPLQVRVPASVRESLKLYAIKSGQPMSTLVFNLLTTQEMLKKSWVSTKKVA